MNGRHLSNRVSDALSRILAGEKGAGLLLAAVAVAAMLAANSPLAHAYHAAFHDPLEWTPIARLDTLHAWINDGLMAIFFFVVGLEIKREIMVGELSSPAQRRLPVLAAACGMAVPAAIFLAFSGGDPSLIRGWAIPAATDIAFAVGLLALVGNRVPASLRLFLLTVAIVDDLGAVMIIAAFYTSAIEPMWLAAAGGAAGAMLVLTRWRHTRTWLVMLLAGALWYCVLHSGVHATVAGVLAALLVPLRIGSHGDSMLLRLEHALVPWSAYLIVPVFGFANAGVEIPLAGWSALAAPLPLAIAAALVLGKPLGIFGAIVGARKFGFASVPAGATMLQLLGVAALCGIGFTMSLFIALLAFPGTPLLIEQAKLGVLAGSLLSALLGLAILRAGPIIPR